jgi:hypothetical protein
VAVVPFHIRYELSRGQRFGPFLYPWLPCLAPCLGFSAGMVVLAFEVSPRFLAALVLPAAVSRNFFRGAAHILRTPVEAVEVVVDEAWVGRVVQVYRDGGRWHVLHADGTELRIPADAVTVEQIEYLKVAALRAAAGRRSGPLPP